MNQFIINLPISFYKIHESLIKKDWLVSPFKVDKKDLYDPAKYIYSEDFYGYQYKLILDRNIFSFIISASLKSKHKQIYRDAIALIVFCQIANIMIEPNLAVYEKINYETSNANEAIKELIQFYKTDNCENKILMNYATGLSNSIILSTKNRWDARKIKAQMTKHQWLKEWKSLYLIVLNLIYISEKENSNKEKLKIFIEWMVKEFRLSLVSIVYAIFLFSSMRQKNMIKYRRRDSVIQRQRQIYNMTWDLFFMNNFFRKWVGKKEKEEFLIATDDKVLKNILEKAILIQMNEDFKAINNYLHPNEKPIIETIRNTINSTHDRIYLSDEWSYEYQEKLIKEKVNMLLN